MRLLPLAALAASLALATGCVVHEARIMVPPQPPVATYEDAPGPDRVLIGSGRVTPAVLDPVVLRGALPQDQRVSVWHRSADGSTLCRAEERAATPLPWWQRFPCDAVVDLVPLDATARIDVIPECTPVPEADAAALAQSARCDGYAPDDAGGTPHGP